MYTAKPEEDSTAPTFTVQVPESEVRKRLQAFLSLTGQQPTQTDLQNILISLINEVRAGRQMFPGVPDYAGLASVDLEAAFDSPPPVEE
jgi:hypothetical protein